VEEKSETLAFTGTFVPNVAVGRSLGNPIIDEWIVQTFFSDCVEQENSQVTI